MIFYWYLLIINLTTFFCFGIDKWKARKGNWRISERCLFLLALFGGSIGAWIGMKFWCHKTLHISFKYGIPIIFIIQVIVYLLLFR
jgi:uncharacterized membrane protein YsdA (DUF1294 family)